MAIGIKPQPESKSIRVTYQDEDGRQVFSCGGQWYPRSINVNYDFIEPEYCQQHKEDIESAITDFMSRLNASLAEDGYPLIKTVNEAQTAE